MGMVRMDVESMKSHLMLAALQTNNQVTPNSFTFVPIQTHFFSNEVVSMGNIIKIKKLSQDFSVIQVITKSVSY